MTNEEKKAYLRRYRVLNRRIDQTRIELKNWEELATNITPKYSDLPKAAGTSDKIQCAIVEIVQLEEKLKILIDELRQKQSDIKIALERIQNNELRDVLWYRYVCGLDWADIAEKMNYSFRYTLFLHEKALKKLEIQKGSTQ